MTYRELLDWLAEFGVKQVSRLKVQDDVEHVLLGRPEEIIFPHPFTCYPVYLDKGLETRIHPDVTAAILRRFGIKDA